MAQVGMDFGDKKGLGMSGADLFHLSASLSVTIYLGYSLPY